MDVIPSLDLLAGRSRLVHWPGASSGSGAPTDRPERIARAFVEAGARAIHLVDLDGASRGKPTNLEAITAVSRAVAVPLQLAGGVDGPEQVEVAFAAGATRVVVPGWAVVEDRPRLRACLGIAGDWLAVGLDARPDRLRAYPWQGQAPPDLQTVVVQLAQEGVRRFVLSHGGTGPDLALLSRLTHEVDADVLVAGGVTSLGAVALLRETGVTALLLGEALFTGAVDFVAARAEADAAAG
jgi:phosphoribosylformimino-5-aminoimidazole carboxamide ribotide isomerase